ncbi:hypothetical protein RN001_007550 [Aquatica leii]|uniref:Uncharacterized protein n=1 Tax=Aquatica leii TaxID=1421715 RepID=A0AAN7SGV8_9COLE|nr:hypothetical protein RN001_007550 [Aquatica leii]
MKTLVVLNIFISVAFSKVSFELIDDWSNVSAPYADECILETGANPEMARKMFENHKLVDEEHIRCYFKCLSLKGKVMSEDGAFIPEALIKLFIHITPDIAYNCVAKFANEEDLCKKAYLVALCITEENYITS